MTILPQCQFINLYCCQKYSPSSSKGAITPTSASIFFVPGVILSDESDFIEKSENYSTFASDQTYFQNNLYVFPWIAAG